MTGPGVDVGFLDRYRQRAGLGYLPPPSWVGGTPPLRADPSVAVFGIDEMGKVDVCPIVFAAEPGAEEVRAGLDRLVPASWPGRLELRLLTGIDGEAGGGGAVSAAAAAGLTVDRIQAGMRADLAGAAPGAAAAPSSADEPVTDGELGELWNVCFGLRLQAADLRRLRTHPCWRDRDLLVLRQDGRLVGSLRLSTDTDGAGERYGFVRGLAIRPELRQASVPLLLRLWSGLRVALAEDRVRRVHMLVDRATGGPGAVFRRAYRSFGFREEVLAYRLRQPVTPA